MPTWEQAAAAVFSSSSSSEENLSSTTHPSSQPALDAGKTHHPPSTTTTTPSPTITILSTSTTPVEAQPRSEPATISYRTRSKTAAARREASNLKSKKATLPTSANPKRKPKRRRGAPAPSKRPKQVKIAPSQIQGAGLGLYLLEDAKANEWIARYSGAPLTKAELDQKSYSQYVMQVHKNLFLDAVEPTHFEGRFINDARNSKFKKNARFAAGYTTNTCSTTGHVWVRIYATRRIKAGEEIFIDYGEDFWSQHRLHTPTATPTPNKTATTSSLWATPAPTLSSLWAAPAPIPDSITISDHTTNSTTTHSVPIPSQTIAWAPQVPTPSHPELLGHNHHMSQPLNLSIPLSPIPVTSPNTNPYMNEIYTYSQMYELDDTLLLPKHIN